MNPLTIQQQRVLMAFTAITHAETTRFWRADKAFTGHSPASAKDRQMLGDLANAGYLERSPVYSTAYRLPTAQPERQKAAAPRPIGKGSRLHKAIEATITRLPLQRKRVKDYMARATEAAPNGPVLHFYDLTEKQAYRLLDKLAQFARKSAPSPKLESAPTPGQVAGHLQGMKALLNGVKQGEHNV